MCRVCRNAYLSIAKIVAAITLIMAPTVRDVGGILQDVGGFGTYQKYLCFTVVGVISGLCSLTFATQLFSLVTPDHWCWNPELAALARQLPLPQEDTKKFSIPLVKERPLPWGEIESASFSQCQRFGGDLVGAYIGWVAAKRPHSHTPVTPGSGRPYPVRGCDQGWAYNHTFHTLTTENNWVCDSKWKTYAVHTAFWLGASLGVYVCGYMANRFGRRITLLLGMLINVIGGVATLVSSGFILLMLSRFVAGLGHLTVNYLALFLVLELCDEDHRVIPLLVMIGAYTMGSLTAPWIARAVVSWWWFTLIITLLSGIVCFTLSWIIPESPWWMLIKGHHKDAVQLLQRIAKVNGKVPWKINQKLLEESCDFWTMNCGKQQLCCLRNNSNSKNDLLELEKIRCYSCRKQFIILNAIWILCSSCYFGKHYISMNLLATAFNTRSDPSSDFTSYWYSALMEIPIWILPFILQGSPKMSQATLILSLTSAASLGIAHALLPTGNVVTSVTIGLIDRLVVTVAYYTMLQRRWEVSISDRITSVTMEISMGLAVSTVPAVIFVGEYYHQMSSLWLGTVASVAAVLSFFLPVSIQSAGDQLTRRKDSVQWLRRCLQSTQLRRTSLLSRDSQNEDESQVVSALPYNLLEST